MLGSGDVSSCVFLTPSLCVMPARFVLPAVIDFGGATFDSEYHATTINTRQYRAPEVMLQVGWGPPSDMWSVACIIMELYVGELLFATVRIALPLA